MDDGLYNTVKINTKYQLLYTSSLQYGWIILHLNSQLGK